MQQQQNTGTQQGMMQQPQPPAVITTKDHLYLTDMLSWNLLAMKKAHFFASQCAEQELKMELEKVGKMHEQHYSRILTHLNSNQQANGAQLQ
ncbi:MULTISPECIES: hypothetical protein [Bacillaceae]|uniref:hypothetical protein n=1 Tax=Bacillaceae TaxID=186817 RepID=UPI000C768ECE|nr:MULTISPECIES: hypothetical protein [Bacillaceae]PLR67132.1 hypothetical protein CYJ36_14235 [Bacillus sp. UMB0893]QNG60543.1 hypothetical protein H4O14_03190 [Bacillus sp. PAMC26568]